ncbi:MAG: hypothetical protein NVS3B18_16070 [Candidatus Dormibacteria bacterium]
MARDPSENKLEMRTPIENVHAALPGLLVVGELAALADGSGGAHTSARSNPSSSATISGQRSASAAPSTATVPRISRRNGADRDIDDNGGPTERDGNL